MAGCTKFVVFKTLTMIGIMMCHMLGKPSLYWGSISVYDMSFISKYGVASPLIQNSWVFVPASICRSFAISQSQRLMKYVPPRIVLLCGILIFDSLFVGSVFISSFSWVTYMLFAGIVLGIGGGTIEGVLLRHYLVEWSGKHDKGKLTSLYAIAPAIGASIFNVGFTWWVNPDNLKVDYKIGKIWLFSQDALLDNVPTAYLFCGAIIATMQLTGLCLLRNRKHFPKTLSLVKTIPSNNYNTFGEQVRNTKRTERQITSAGNHQNTNSDIEVTFEKSNTDYNNELSKSISLRDNPQQELLQNGTTPTKNCTFDKGIVKRDQSEHSASERNQPDRRAESDKSQHETWIDTADNIETPSEPLLEQSANIASYCNENETFWEFIRNKHFLKLWYYHFCQGMAIKIVSFYYKVYGEVWIKDDYFLTDIATVMLITGIFFTLSFGVIMDKIGVKNCMVLMCSIVTLSCIMMYFAPMIDKWLYLVVTSLAHGVTASSFLYVIRACDALFGKKNIGRNVAMIVTAGVIGNPVFSIFAEIFVNAFGFFSLFTFTNSLLVTSLIVVTTFPNI